MSNIDLEKIRQYFTLQPVEKAWIFGSYARGEETEKSDLDILISIPEKTPFSLMNHAKMITDLEDLLNLEVDVVRLGSVFPEIAPFIENEKILIYERAN